MSSNRVSDLVTRFRDEGVERGGREIKDTKRRLNIIAPFQLPPGFIQKYIKGQRSKGLSFCEQPVKWKSELSDEEGS